MPISSVIVRTSAGRAAEVAGHLKDFPESTVEKIHGDNVVLVTETRDQDHDRALWERIENVPGVIQCDLIYHNFEDVEGTRHV